MDRIDLFRIFARVVECSSFTRAADTLGLPRSSVSAAVQELEVRLGTRLLHRTTRQVSATQDGKAFYERCLRLVADIEEAEALFSHSGSKPSGKLRVDMPGRIGRLVVAPALPDFLAQYPQIDVELGVTDRAVNLVEERVDCVLRVGALSESGLIARLIGQLELINVASPFYLSSHGTPLTPVDLKDHLAVHYASPNTGRLEEWEWMEAGRVHSLPMRGRVSVNNAEASIACCLAGLGLIQVPAYDVRAHIQGGELVQVLPQYCAAPMPMNLVYSHRNHLSRRLSVFMDWLTMLLQKELFLSGA